MRSIKIVLILTGVLFAGPAMAQDVVLPTVTLSTTNIVPPPVSNAMATASFTLNPSSRQLTWQLTVNGLTTPPIAVDLERLSDAGLQPVLNLPFNATQEPMRGSATLSPTQAAELMAGQFAIVLRTTAYPRGELRGLIKPQ